MEPNNFEKNIQEQFNKRTVEPSAQAWDRLDAMLTVSEEKKPKKGFFWLRIAASFIVFLGIGFFLIENKEGIKTKQEIVFEQKLEQDDAKSDSNSFNPKEENSKTSALATNNGYYGNQKNEVKINEELVSDKPQQIKNLTNYLTDDSSFKNSQINNEITTVNKRKYNYITPESLLAEVEGNKKTIHAKNSYKSTLSVDANDLLSSAESELNQSFKDKAFAKFKEVQAVYNNRNLE